MRILPITFIILMLCFILVFLILSNTRIAKLNCEEIDKTNCTDDSDCICKSSPCLGTVNKKYAACEELRQKLAESIETCTDVCPPFTPLYSLMEWKPLCLNNKCTNAYVNESFICILPNNCTKR
jgi:hypothetical protein